MVLKNYGVTLVLTNNKRVNAYSHWRLIVGSGSVTLNIGPLYPPTTVPATFISYNHFCRSDWDKKTML
jgi:hypothetical protein